MIKLDNLNKYYYKNKSNENHVINDTSLELPESGLVSLLGPSGCGKTTLLNVIGGLDKANSGDVYIDGEKITGRGSGKVDSIRNAKIGYIFQNYNLFDDMSVFDNVAIALKMVGIKDKQVIDERVGYCLDAVGMYKFRRRNAGALSGGQRQRVAIARAIVKNPRIIIADEPTGNLDSANTLEVMNIIKSISKDRLVLLVTHEKDIAKFYSTRIIELKDGKIVSDRENDSTRYLDYQIENRIYLKDMPVCKKFRDGEVNVGVYGNEEVQANINIAIRGGNLYIDTGGAYNVVGDDANIELIDDHYRAIDSENYEKNSFEYDKYLPKNYKPKYTPIYTPFNNLTKGFKSIARFNKGKKVLLIGFVFAAMFAFFAISNIMGVKTVKPSYYITDNVHYLTVSNTAKNEDMINKVAGTKGIKYAIPGNSKVGLNLDIKDCYQMSAAEAKISGSLALSSVLEKKELKIGRMPENDHDIAIDNSVARKFIKDGSGKNAGIISKRDLPGMKIKLKSGEQYIISGIVDTHSPSIYVNDSQYMNILINSSADKSENKSGDMENQENDGEIRDYSKSSGLTIKRGHAPENLYQVIVNENRADDMPLNKTISTKMNGHLLTVVGYYNSDKIEGTYYVSPDTIRADYIGRQKVLTAYADDVHEAQNQLKAEGINAKINSEEAYTEYRNTNKNKVRNAILAALIILAISLMEIYLMLRSSFLSRIKEVGTMRAIGLKKREVRRVFSGEIVAITILTAIPGIAIMYYFLGNIIRISDSFKMMYMVNPMTAVITFALLLLFNLVAGLLPVFTTMRKKPAQILSRTDI